MGNSRNNMDKDAKVLGRVVGAVLISLGTFGIKAIKDVIESKQSQPAASTKTFKLFGKKGKK